MSIRPQHRLRLDRPAHILFSALWMAPVAMPLSVATLSPWIVSGQSPERVAAHMAPAAGELESAEAAQEKRIRVSMRVPVAAQPPHIMPGAAPIRPSRLELASHDVRVARHSIRRPAGRHVFRNVEVAEGLRLGGDGLSITLAGLTPVGPDKVCRRLDGVVESCSMRAMHRLEVLTQGRAVTCDLRPADQDGDVLGTCHADKIDIADDLVRQGLATRSGA